MNRIVFPNDYFKDEYREGFLVESMMKRAWAAQLEVLKRIEEICDKYGLQYFGFWGTLLGAVRHNGYVPWDDDFDIIMKRADYDKFLEVAATELPDGYVVMTPYTEVEWDEQIARVTNSHSINFTDRFLNTYHGCPFVAGVDIFPYDFIPDDESLCKEKDELINRVSVTRNLYIEKKKRIAAGIYRNELDSQINSGVSYLEKLFDIKFNKDVHLDNQLLCLYDQIAQSYSSEKDKFLTCYVERAKRQQHGRDFRIPSYWLEESIDVSFECTTIRIPKYYELCLSACYGKNFITPIKAGIAGHDYPFYGKQIDTLREIGRYDEVMDAVKRADDRMFENIAYEEKAINEIISEEIITGYMNQNSNSKKLLMFCLSSMDIYEHENECIQKLERVLEQFRISSDCIDVIIVDAPLTYELFTRKNDKLYDKYCNLINEFLVSGYGQLIDYYDAVGISEHCDAYYGSYNECAKLFVDSKKPVMIINAEI